MIHSKSGGLPPLVQGTLDYLSTINQLYTFSLESHALRVIQCLTKQNDLEQLSRLSKTCTSDGLLIRIRDLLRQNMTVEKDEFLELIHRLFSETRWAKPAKSNSLERENERLSSQVADLQRAVERLRREPLQNGSTGSDLLRQLENMEKHLENKTSVERELKKEVQLLKSRLESQTKKHTRKLKEMDEIMAANKRQKTTMAAEVKSLNELIRRFEAENNEHIKKISQLDEENNLLKEQIKMEQEGKSIKTLKTTTFDLKLKDMQKVIEEQQSRLQSSKLQLATSKLALQQSVNKLTQTEMALKETTREIQRLKTVQIPAQPANTNCRDCQLSLIKMSSTTQLHQRELFNLKQSILQKDNKISSVQSELERCRSSLQSKIDDLQSLNLKLMQNLDGESNQLIKHIGKLQEDNTTLVMQLKEVVKEYNESLLEAEDKIMFLNQTIKKYEEQLDAVYKSKDMLDLEIRERDLEIQKNKKMSMVQFTKMANEINMIRQQEDRTKKQLQAKISQSSSAKETLVEAQCRVKQLQSEMTKFRSLIDTLKKKFHRKMQIILSKVKSSIRRLADENVQLKELVKSQLKSSKQTLEKQFREQLNKYTREYLRFKELLNGQQKLKCQELMKEVYLLKRELARREQIEIIKEEQKIMAKRQILGHLQNKSPEKTLQRNVSCKDMSSRMERKDMRDDDVRQSRRQVDLVARRTGFENIRNQIIEEQKKLLSSLKDQY